MTAYAELATTTNFSFLRGASSPQDMVLAALLLEHNGIGIADRNTVAGVVRAYATIKDILAGERPVRRMREGSGPGEYVLVMPGLLEGMPISFEELQARTRNFKLAVGTRFVFADGTPDIIAYPENREGWGALCRILTIGNRRAKKGDCILYIDDLLARCGDLLLVVMPGEVDSSLCSLLARLREAAGGVWLGASMLYKGRDRRRLACLNALSATCRVPLIALNDVLYHSPDERDLQDVVTCIREGKSIEAAGTLLLANAERHLKPAEDMVRIFRSCPAAIEEVHNLITRMEFSLKQLKYEYPEELVPPGLVPQSYLEEMTWRRAAVHYKGEIPEKVRKVLVKELNLIARFDYATYFLTIYDIVQKAEELGILCQGRGSAANSAVCFVLGITSVDPATSELLFARFLSEERREPPDIDVDFEHERREEIIQYLYGKYGRHRAGIAATVIHYRPKSAIREVGKVFGLSEDVTSRIAGTVWGSWGRDELPDHRIRQAGLDPLNPTIRRAVEFASRLLDFPRHLSQHVGGFVLARYRLDETVPIGNAAMEERTFIEWDKDDIDALGMMKVDVLALGMLTCIRKAFDLIEDHYGEKLAMNGLEPDDKKTFAMLQRGESIGVFQVESRAQINMLPRLKPKVFYDLVIQVAIVRPGPIQGNMVHPYLSRRHKPPEEIVYPKPGPPHDPDELKKVLERTLGVPLFQEQAMSIAIEAAKFTDAEANQLRKAMATFRSNGKIRDFEAMMVERMVDRGYERQFAQRCFDQIKGFGEYGFPESHAASFGKLVYVSAWLKCHHPEVFACALLNSQPMGFYAPAQIVSDARKSKVEVREVDINHSRHDNTLEARAGKKQCALRIGFRQIDGFKDEWGYHIADVRAAGFDSIEELWRRSGLPARALRMLADADAFRSLGIDRREALWIIRRLPDDVPLPLFAAAERHELSQEESAHLPDMPLSEHVVADYQTIRLSLKAHPMRFLRDLFKEEGVSSCVGLAELPDGAKARVAGIVLVRQRPGKGNAIFMTLEDETGVANALIWARRFERYRRPIMAARLALVEGRVQKSPEGVVHLIAMAVHDRSGELDRLSSSYRARPELAYADEVLKPQAPRNHGHPRNVRVIPKSRDFH